MAFGKQHARDCAAIVRRRYLVGGYGSWIDMQRWQFLIRPRWVREGLICDRCIDRLKMENLIFLVEG